MVKKPDPVAICTTPVSDELSELVNDVSLKSSPILMRSGGHSYAGFSTGHGLVLDSREQKTIIEKKESLVLGAGLTLKEAQDKLSPLGFTFPSGEFPGVGIAGFFLGGGHSRRSRYLGLGADCVKSISVMLATGERIPNVSPTHHSDLFWALLGGGGGQFAFVDSFEIAKIPKFKEYFFKYTFLSSANSRGRDIFHFWEKYMQSAPNTIGVNLTMYINNGYISKLNVSGLKMNTSLASESIEDDFKTTGWQELQQFSPSEFEINVSDPNEIKEKKTAEMFFKGASHYADESIGAEGFDRIKDSIGKYSKQTNMYMGFYSMGGKIQKPDREISYPHRNALFMLDLFSNFTSDSSKHDLYRINFNSMYSSMDSLFSGRSYVNYPNLDYGIDWPNRYYGSSLERLKKIKKYYDPENRFDYGDHSLSRLV